jgi:hypothetical protein
MLKIGGETPTQVYIGTQPVLALYMGTEKIWPVGGTTIGTVTITGEIITGPVFDPDAAAYIAAVEAADGQALEDGVRAAMNELIIAVKAIGFNMNTFFLLAGPRTLAGALVMPGSLAVLTGSNLVSANYERKSGYLGVNGPAGGDITSFHPTFLNGNVQQSTGLYLSEGGTTVGVGYERYQSAFSDIGFPAPGSGFDEMTVSTGGPVMRVNLATPTGDNPGGVAAIDWFTTPGAYYQRRLSSTAVQFGSPARGVIDASQDHNPATTWTGPITTLPSGRMAALYQGNRIDDVALGAAIAQYLEALDTAVQPELPVATDPDAIAYITAVEAADGQVLEDAIRVAIDDFVIALKAAPGLWESLPVLAPFAGARTVEGAMVPLRGAAGPFVANNITSGDYDRIRGFTFGPGANIIPGSPDYDWGSTLTGMGALSTVQVDDLPPPWAHLILYDRWPYERGLISAADITPGQGNILMMGIQSNDVGLITELVVMPLAANNYIAVSRISNTQHRSSFSGGTVVRNSVFSPESPERPIPHVFSPNQGFRMMGAFFSVGLSDANNNAFRVILTRFQEDLAAGVGPDPPRASDPDANAYILAVEAADGQALEAGVRMAIDAFVIGCKADGIWAALEICNLFMGARTLAGAIIPLKGSYTPVATNFTEGDYNRRRLRGDSTSKGVDTGYSITAYPAPDIAPPNHYSWMHIMLPNSAELEVHMGAELSGVLWSQAFTTLNLSMRNYSPSSFDTPSFPAGFYGIARNSQATVDVAGSAVQRGIAQATARLDSGVGTVTVPVTIFKNSNPGFEFYSAAEISWYSYGGYLDIALLKSRVEALSAALATAIP